MMTKGWRYNPTGFVCDANADTVCRIAARSDQDEIGTAIAQVPAMVHFLRRIADGRDYVRPYENEKALDELQADARAILAALEGEK